MMMTLGRLTLHRIQSEIPDPARHDQADVTVAQIHSAESFRATLRPSLPSRHRNFEANRTRRIPETIHVFLQAKDAAVVKTNAFENAVAVKQTVIEDRNFRVRFGKKFAVDVNF